MNNENDNNMTIINAGIEVEYEILLSFDRVDTGKEYIVYTDHSKDADGNTKVFAAVYDPGTDQLLKSIPTEEEWNYVEQMLCAAQKDYLINH